MLLPSYGPPALLWLLWLFAACTSLPFAAAGASATALPKSRGVDHEHEHGHDHHDHHHHHHHHHHHGDDHHENHLGCGSGHPKIANEPVLVEGQEHGRRLSGIINRQPEHLWPNATNSKPIRVVFNVELVENPDLDIYSYGNAANNEESQYWKGGTGGRLSCSQAGQKICPYYSSSSDCDPPQTCSDQDVMTRGKIARMKRSFTWASKYLASAFSVIPRKEPVKWTNETTPWVYRSPEEKKLVTVHTWPADFGPRSVQDADLVVIISARKCYSKSIGAYAQCRVRDKNRRCIIGW